MTTLFTRQEAKAAGITDDRLAWQVERGRYLRLAQGVYFKGDRSPGPFEHRLANAMRARKPITGELAAALHGMDGFDVPPDGRYGNIPKSSAGETLLTIAATVNDLRWEQALEWSLRKHTTSISALEMSLNTQRSGNGRIRRVLKVRPNGSAPTGSILETFTIQLIRSNAALPTPSRQVEVLRAFGQRAAYVDLAWPRHGVFLELDGEQHKGQPLYDATRQTAVVAATGWLVGRFTWTDVVHHPAATLRKIEDLLAASRNMTRAIA